MWILGAGLAFWLIWSAIVLVAPLAAAGALLWIATRVIKTLTASNNSRDITPRN